MTRAAYDLGLRCTLIHDTCATRNLDFLYLDSLFLLGYSLNLPGVPSRGEADTVLLHARGQGGSAIRLFMILSLAFVLAPTAVHADLVTYTLTGTIQDVVGYSGMYGGLDPGASLPVAKGDRIAWTVRYDRSAPTTNFPNTVALTRGITLQDSYYAPSGPLIRTIVDQTNGYHVYTSPADSIPAGSYSPSAPFHTYSLLGLLNFQGNGGTEGRVGFIDFQQSAPKGAIPYYAAVDLTSNRLLASLNLANLPLDQVPFRFHDASTPADLQFYYKGQIPDSQTYFSFGAQIDSLSAAGSITSLPEPGALTLFGLGVAGLAVRRCRHALGRAG